MNNPIEYILDCIKTIYCIQHKNGAIRRVNVNIAATTVENYRKLQGRRHRHLHPLPGDLPQGELSSACIPTGPKHNYAYHTEAMDRAMEGGIDDVGLGVLFGLELYQYEFAGLLMHAEHLEAVHGVGPHTISVPRIKRADDIDPSAFRQRHRATRSFSEDHRLHPHRRALHRHDHLDPRERGGARACAARWASRRSAAARARRSAATPRTERPHDTEQFDVSDQRTLDEVVRWLMEMGFIPSFCTACYREGRTGDRFMSLCKSGQILNCCHPNALMTLTEFLTDYASERDEGGRVMT